MSQPSQPPIPILLEEPHFLVVDKPAGLFSQAPSGVPSLQQRLIDQLRERDDHPGNPFIGLPHRLDRATTGAMLIARNARALKRFNLQFQSRKIGKFYLAIVEGTLPPGVHIWEDRIRKVDQEARAEIVRDATSGRHARLDVMSIAEDTTLSLLLVRLHTGRMHQIRLQAASRHRPVLGDRLYGSVQNFVREPVEGLRDQRLQPIALHSLRLEFRHPQTAIQMSATAPLPAFWKDASQHLWDVAQAWIAASRQQSQTGWSLEQL